MAQVRGSLSISPGRAGTSGLEGTLEAVESKGCPFHTRKHSEMDTAWPDVTRVRGQAVGTGTLLPGPLCFGGRSALTLGVPTGGGPQVVLGRRGLWEKAQMGCSSGLPTTPTSPHPHCSELSLSTCYADRTPRHSQRRRFSWLINSPIGQAAKTQT